MFVIRMLVLVALVTISTSLPAQESGEQNNSSQLKVVHVQQLDTTTVKAESFCSIIFDVKVRNYDGAPHTDVLYSSRHGITFVGEPDVTIHKEQLYRFTYIMPTWKGLTPFVLLKVKKVESCENGK